jgi:hypothetical protein
LSAINAQNKQIKTKDVNKKRDAKKSHPIVVGVIKNVSGSNFKTNLVYYV